ncbi:MAG: hypothetical protein OEV59_04775 [Deltaproteobacteria bacterium]|nr:hypothetical protein [Deltaproteobacteria bacterium]
MATFWEKMSGELKKAAQNGWEAVKVGAKKASDKGEEVAKVSKLRYNAYSKHKEAENILSELGGKVYDLSKTPSENPFANEGVKGLVEKVRKIEEEVAAIETEIAAIKVKGGNGSDDTSKDQPAQ